MKQGFENKSSRFPFQKKNPRSDHEIEVEHHEVDTP